MQRPLLCALKTEDSSKDKAKGTGKVKGQGVIFAGKDKENDRRKCGLRYVAFFPFRDGGTWEVPSLTAGVNEV